MLRPINRADGFLRHLPFHQQNDPRNWQRGRGRCRILQRTDRKADLRHGDGKTLTGAASKKESLFSLTQTVLMISWGRASDRFGRKPVLVFSLAGLSIASALFGFSTTLWQMILFRCCAGAFGGTVV